MVGQQTKMTPSIFSRLYAGFAAYWWLVVLWTIVRMKKDRLWLPGGMVTLEQQFKIKVSRSAWLSLLVVTAALVTVSSFWLPHFLVDESSR